MTHADGFPGRRAFSASFGEVPMHRPSTTDQNFPLPSARRLARSVVLLAALIAGGACGDDPAGTPPGNTGRDGEPGPTHDAASNGNRPDAERDSAPVTDPLADAPSQPSDANPQPEASAVDASK